MSNECIFVYILYFLMKNGESAQKPLHACEQQQKQKNVTYEMLKNSPLDSLFKI